MKNSLRRILITASPYFDLVILQQLERIAQINSLQIHLFDNTRFNSENMSDSESESELNESNTSNTKIQYKNFEHNVGVGRQLATALIHDVDLRVNKGCPESRDNKLSFHEKLHRNQTLWYSVQQYLIKHEIDSVVFSSNPQGLPELVLYQVSKARKIDVLILYQSPFLDRFFSYGSIPDCGNYDNNVNCSTDYLNSKNEILTNRKHEQNYCQETNVSDFFKILSFLLKVRSLKLFDPMYILKHAKHLHDAPTNTAHWIDPFANFFYCKPTAYFEFLTNRYAYNTDQSQKFVYFPLQSLAELNSEIIDNQFGDQLLALERLALLVSIDCTIYIKNNPSRDSDYLTPMFFHRVKRIPNVVRLPSCIQSEQLIDNSIFVATVSSEEGWKALSRGKSVLTFGKPWYRKLPGAFEYYEGIEYSEITQSELSEAIYVRHINRLLAHSHIGRLYSKDKYNAINSKNADNAKCVAETILELVSGKSRPTFQSELT